ncbi:MAG: hypothetical protein ACI9QN_002450, partial [Arcticibacterium sp.]
GILVYKTKIVTNVSLKVFKVSELTNFLMSNSGFIDWSIVKHHLFSFLAIGV